MFGTHWDIQVGARTGGDLSVVPVERQLALKDVEGLFFARLDMRRGASARWDDRLNQEIGTGCTRAGCQVPVFIAGTEYDLGPVCGVDDLDFSCCHGFRDVVIAWFQAEFLW